MKRIRRLRGQAMHEYLVILAIVLGVFGLPAFDGKPLLVFFAEAVATGFARFLASISLPL
ncbi:MAG TPA: hypothetical protein PKX14_12545 [Thauera aminoaromatica]|jgi:hypothetical protein|uniref:Uncharacterized protein n=2 Tax=Thauera aminoaromatica TaxID=164330 RepID=N6YAQ4_THASP|nr:MULTISPECIES: hypothetical protein [Thauera]ACR01293.1 hypothetical protein Tmz1t_2691 [Thauera aminoaromatica]ENO88605.1 hypothetical protein C665_01993 [Thauera aminoaromatica S2]KIN88858.1 putative membrane protein [Thauera sp. SWB20]MBL8462758.1 hypothetical protein [Thauera sp.]MBP6132223.1 hypothetical protein [Thauera sp.]